MRGIPGLEAIVNVETEDIYYTNKKMIEAGVYFRVSTYENEEIELGTYGCIETLVEVACMNDDHTYVGRFIMVWGPLKSDIELYRIIKDLYDLYLDNNKNEYLKILKEFSSQYYDSEINGRDNMVEELQAEFDSLNEFIGERER